MSIPYEQLPTINALLNGTCAVLLLAGLVAIRARREHAHVLCMVLALAVSLLFLTSYLTYHAHAGSKPFTGRGWIRPVYFTILISHTVLAVVIVPLALRTVYLAIRKRLSGHVRLARWTLPLWLYVSITGVVIYLMLYHGTAWACPNCKEMVSGTGAEPSGLARGFYWSILLMLTMPFVLMGGMSWLIVRGARHAKRNGRL